MVYDNYEADKLAPERGQGYDEYGVTMFSRLEIPVRNRFNLKKYAGILRDLADELDRLSRDTETKDVFIAIRVQTEVQYANRGIQRLAQRTAQAKKGCRPG